MNTVENTAEYVFKGILQELYCQWENGDRFHPTSDDYLWANMADLGYAAYTFIGDYFGDADTAAKDLGLK